MAEQIMPPVNTVPRAGRSPAIFLCNTAAVAEEDGVLQVELPLLALRAAPQVVQVVQVAPL
jgi:hypothetical protein